MLFFVGVVFVFVVVVVAATHDAYIPNSVVLTR